MLALPLLRPASGPAEQRYTAATLPAAPASQAQITITQGRLEQRFPGGAFNHLTRGVVFGEQVEVRLTRPLPVYTLFIRIKDWIGG